jgi:predicted dehydrogenase
VSDRMRAGIIGVGFMGTVHARAVRACGATVAAIAASSAERARSAAIRMSADAIAESASELIDRDDVDVVHICTPNDLHLPLAEQALAAGKHVICEKPLATDLPSALRLADAAASAAARGVVTAVPFVYRYYPVVREARARVRRGDAGRLHLLHGSYLQDWLSGPEDTDWRVDSGRGGASRAFADIGVHWCDVVEFVSGHRITRLLGKMLTAYDARGAGDAKVTVATEDAATVLFETDQGALGSVVVSQVSPGRKNRLWFSLDGAEASLAVDQEIPESLWVGTSRAVSLIPRGSDDASPDARVFDRLPAGHPQGYQDCFTAFVADTYTAIGGGSPDSMPTFDDGLRAARITDSVLASAAGACWVEVP